MQGDFICKSFLPYRYILQCRDEWMRARHTNPRHIESGSNLQSQECVCVYTFMRSSHAQCADMSVSRTISKGLWVLWLVSSITRFLKTLNISLRDLGVFKLLYFPLTYIMDVCLSVWCFMKIRLELLSENLVSDRNLKILSYSPNTSWLIVQNNIWRLVEIMQLLIMYTAPTSSYLVPLRPQYPPQHPILKRPQRTFLLQCEKPRSTPTQNKRINCSSDVSFMGTAIN